MRLRRPYWLGHAAIPLSQSFDSSYSGVAPHYAMKDAGPKPLSVRPFLFGVNHDRGSCKMILHVHLMTQRPDRIFGLPIASGKNNQKVQAGVRM